MNQTKNVILYIAFGNRCINQALYSIISLINIYKTKISSFVVLIYTNQPTAFLWLGRYVPVEIIDITPEQLEDWNGRNAQTLRVKIKVIENVLNSRDVTLLYVDTDTLFLRRVDDLFDKIRKGFFILHLREWRLANGRRLHPEFCPNDLEFNLESGSYLKIDAETLMWNSGVIGVSSAKSEKITDVLELNDKLYSLHPSWHVEQFAFSVVFQETGRLIDAKNQIFHYWHNKDVVEPYSCNLQMLKIEMLPQVLEKAKKDKLLLLTTILFKFNKLRQKKMLLKLPGIYKLYLFVKSINNFIRNYTGVSFRMIL